METKNENERFKDSIKFIFTISGKKITEDGIADFTEIMENEKIGYFLSKNVEQSVIEKAVENAPNYTGVYLVFGNEKEYRKIRDAIPKNIGIILMGNLYGLGNMISTVRKPQ